MPHFICPNCNYETSRNEPFCCKCGAKMELVPEKEFCKACGKELPPYDEFCTRCGARRNTTKPQNRSSKILWFLPGLLVATSVVMASPRYRGNNLKNSNISPQLNPQTNQQNTNIRQYLTKEQNAQIDYNTGRRYEYGLEGNVKDINMAVIYYRKAAEAGNEDAKKALKRLAY